MRLAILLLTAMACFGQGSQIDFRTQVKNKTSDQVTYTAPGVGAVARTQASKNQDTVSVKDYGACGDGTCDDTAAIVSAIAATPTGGTLYFPQACYKFSTLTISSDITLRGDSPRLPSTDFGQTTPPRVWQCDGTNLLGTILKSTATTGTAIYLTGIATRTNFEHIGVVGPGTGTSVGITASVSGNASPAYAHFDDLQIGNFYTCLDLLGATAMRGDGVQTIGCTHPFIVDNQSYSNTFYHTNVDYGGSGGLSFANGNASNRFFGLTCGDTLSGPCVDFGGDSINDLISGLYCEDVTEAGFAPTACLQFDGSSHYNNVDTATMVSPADGVIFGGTAYQNSISHVWFTSNTSQSIVSNGGGGNVIESAQLPTTITQTVPLNLLTWDGNGSHYLSPVSMASPITEYGANGPVIDMVTGLTADGNAILNYIDASTNPLAYFTYNYFYDEFRTHSTVKGVDSFKLKGNGHLANAQAVAPTVTFCGTGASVSGTDMKGTIAEGSAATGCTLNFNTSYAANPTCTISSRSGLGFTYTVPGERTFVVTNVGALSSTLLDYICVE